MVTVPRLMFDGLLRVTCTVSSGSSMVSPVTATAMFFVVSPGAKVRVPEARV